MAANSYDQYVGDEVFLPDKKGDKIIVKFSKRIKYDYSSIDKGNYNPMHNKSLYKVEYPDETTEQLEANIISENMMSQVYSEGHHYQLLTEVTDQNKYGSSIAKVDGFVKSSSGNLHQKSTTSGLKLLVWCKDGSVD